MDDCLNMFISFNSILILFQWSSIDELDKLAQFEDFKFRFNPLITDTKESEETIRSLLIAKIGKLSMCNRTEVSYFRWCGW